MSIIDVRYDIIDVKFFRFHQKTCRSIMDSGRDLRTVF